MLTNCQIYIYPISHEYPNRIPEVLSIFAGICEYLLKKCFLETKFLKIMTLHNDYSYPNSSLETKFK